MTLIAALASGCTDFATPAELDRPQILAIVAEPPAVSPGERAQLSVVVAGPDGEIDSAPTTWSSVAPVPDALPIGDIEVDGDTVYYTAPAEQPAMNPSVALVEVAVDAGGDGPLLANKAVVVGSLRLANPVLESFTAGDTDLLSEPTVSASVGSTVALEIGVVDGLPIDGFVSWYATVGAIELYRSNPTEVVFEEPGDGWLFAVVRDGMGGIAWAKARVIVE